MTMYNDDTRETYVERRKAENLAQAERSYEITVAIGTCGYFYFSGLWLKNFMVSIGTKCTRTNPQ